MYVILVNTLFEWLSCRKHHQSIFMISIIKLEFEKNTKSTIIGGILPNILHTFYKKKSLNEKACKEKSIFLS